MGERRAKVSSVYVELLLAGDVHVLAAGAVHFHATGRKFLADADGEHILTLAKHARTVAERPEHELLLHHGEPARREDEARVNEAVQVHGRLVDLEEVLVVEVLGVGRLGGEDHLHGFVEVGDLLAEAVQVEVVADVVLVHLDEELVALQVAEPADPAGA